MPSPSFSFSFRPNSVVSLATLVTVFSSCVSMPGPSAGEEARARLVRSERQSNVAAPGEHPDLRQVSSLRSAISNDAPALQVLYLHGTPGEAEGWTDYLVDPVEGLPALAVDRPGFGESDGSSLATLEGQSRALAPFLGGDAPPTVVVGHSYGGPVALQAAVDYPSKVVGAVILAGSVSPALERRRWFNYAAKGLSWVLPRDLRRSNQEVWPLKADLQRLSGRLAEIAIPVSIVHGTEDSLVPYGNATFMEEALLGAQSVTLTTLEGAGHMFIWDEKWIPSVRRAVRDMVGRVQ